MLRWLRRLLVLGVIAVVGIMVISKLTNREEDFDDYDDLEGGFDFQETPVEIEVPAEQFASVGAATASASSTANADPVSSSGSDSASDAASSNGSEKGSSASSDRSNGNGAGNSLETTRLTSEENLTDIVGIGPAFDARLRAIGINSISELAQADPNAISEQVDVIGGVATVEDWIAQAKNLTSRGNSDGNGQ